MLVMLVRLLTHLVHSPSLPPSPAPRPLYIDGAAAAAPAATEAIQEEQKPKQDNAAATQGENTNQAHAKFQPFFLPVQAAGIDRGNV